MCQPFISVGYPSLLADAEMTMREQTSWSDDFEKCIGISLAEPKYKDEPIQVNYYQK